MTIRSNISTVTVSQIGTVLPIYLSQEEVNTMVGRKNTEPWTTAYNQFISSANSKLSMPIKSVTYGGTNPPTGDKHDYYSGAPGGDRTDYQAAMDVCKAIRDLGLAYIFTSNGQYADKAIDLINGWLLDGWTGNATNNGICPSCSGTYMNPILRCYKSDGSGLCTSGSGGNTQANIENFITLPSLFYGASLIWNYSGFFSDNKTKLKNWITRVLANLYVPNGWNGSQNYDSWNCVLRLSGSILMNDQTKFNQAVNAWKSLIPYQQDSNGSFVNERTRGEGGWAYSMYNLNAWINVAEIARHNGADLYGYTTGGKGLELALDFHAPYAVQAYTGFGPSGWPYTKCTQSDTTKCRQVGCNDDAGGSIYEVVYKHFPSKTAYRNVATSAKNGACGRPRFDARIMGYVTLTHGV